MPQLKVPCPHCHRATAIDSEKLPDQAVSFKCPHCKGKVVADKAQLMAELAAGAPPAPRPTTTTSPFEDDSNGLPPGAAIPPGYIVGEDQAAIEEVRQILGQYDCELESGATVEEIRDQILLDTPSLVIYVAGSVGAPPHEPMGMLLGVPPRERRKVFIVLVADNLKTLDGNAAFMYQVNLCVAKSELRMIAAAIYTGLDYHHRLYKPYFDAIEAA